MWGKEGYGSGVVRSQIRPFVNGSSEPYLSIFLKKEQESKKRVSLFVPLSASQFGTKGSGGPTP